MSSNAGPSHVPMVGEDVMLLVHTDDRPTWTMARISKRDPLTVELEASSGHLFSNVNILVLHDSGRKYSKGEGRVAELSEGEDKAWIRFAEFRWESVDNRDNPRFDTTLQVVVRTIMEAEGTMLAEDQVGMTKNISLGGALIELSAPLAKGQLVEFRVTPEVGQAVRAMGVVAHTNEAGTLVGINFLEYFGSARYILHQFLSKLAA